MPHPRCGSKKPWTQYPVNVPPLTPIPDNATFCGLPAALSVTLSAAVRVPSTAGVNLALMLQVAPAASELPQVWVCAKSPALVPIIAMPVMVKVVVPTFFRLTVFGRLVVPSPIEPKLKLIGESFAAVPIPLSVTFCGLPDALSLMLSAAVRVPDTVGLNLMLILQLAPTASELPQV